MQELLNRVLYAGYIEHKDWGIALTKGHHEPLISLETYQAIQDRLHGRKPKLVTTKANLHAQMPLRGFVRCASCGGALTGGRSKGRHKHYIYYECQAKGCPDRRKSIRKEQIEGDFEALLATMRPSRDLFRLLTTILKDLWDNQAQRGAEMIRTAKAELAAIEQDIERLVDRTLDTTNSTLAKRYEDRINDLEARKLVLTEQQGKIGRPRQSFKEVSRTAMAFLANPLILWNSERLEDKRAVLKLTFSDQLSYCRKNGYRTANLSSPFKPLKDISTMKKEMVHHSGQKREPVGNRHPTLKAGHFQYVAFRSALVSMVIEMVVVHQIKLLHSYESLI